MEQERNTKLIRVAFQCIDTRTTAAWRRKWRWNVSEQRHVEKRKISKTSILRFRLHAMTGGVACRTLRAEISFLMCLNRNSSFTSAIEFPERNNFRFRPSRHEYSIMCQVTAIWNTKQKEQQTTTRRKCDVFNFNYTLNRSSHRAGRINVCLAINQDYLGKLSQGVRRLFRNFRPFTVAAKNLFLANRSLVFVMIPETTTQEENFTTWGLFSYQNRKTFFVSPLGLIKFWK